MSPDAECPECHGLGYYYEVLFFDDSAPDRVEGCCTGCPAAVRWHFRNVEMFRDPA